MLVCPKCHNHLPDEARFCSNCGARFRVNPQGQQPRPQPTYQPPQSPPVKWGPLRAYKTMWNGFSNFKGRSCRSEYWWATLGNFIIMVAGIMLLEALRIDEEAVLTVLRIYSVAAFLPALSLSVRRLHDIGKGGATLFWLLVPIFGYVYIIILACRESQPGSNRYGCNSKEV